MWCCMLLCGISCYYAVLYVAMWCFMLLWGVVCCCVVLCVTMFLCGAVYCCVSVCCVVLCCCRVSLFFPPPPTFSTHLPISPPFTHVGFGTSQAASTSLGTPGFGVLSNQAAPASNLFGAAKPAGSLFGATSTPGWWWWVVVWGGWGGGGDIYEG